MKTTKLDKVTRFEVINHKHDDMGTNKHGRMLVEYGVKVELSLQDDGRTLKVFLTDSHKGGAE